MKDSPDCQTIPQTPWYKVIKVERFLSYTCSHHSANLDGKLFFYSIPQTHPLIWIQLKMPLQLRLPVASQLPNTPIKLLRNNQTSKELKQVAQGKRDSLQQWYWVNTPLNNNKNKTNKKKTKPGDRFKVPSCIAISFESIFYQFFSLLRTLQNCNPTLFKCQLQSAFSVFFFIS